MISPPTLVLAGANEEVLQIDHVKALAATIPNAELILIDNAGHGVLDEQFEAWIAAVQAFLDRSETERE
jgi:pimeloyl-ACP methyl ester carboxylesterase